MQQFQSWIAEKEREFQRWATEIANLADERVVIRKEIERCEKGVADWTQKVQQLGSELQSLTSVTCDLGPHIMGTIIAGRVVVTSSLHGQLSDSGWYEVSSWGEPSGIPDVSESSSSSDEFIPGKSIGDDDETITTTTYTRTTNYLRFWCLAHNSD